MNPEIIDIPIREIRPFVSRARPREPFNRLKASIREHGVLIPVQVRELARKKDGYRFERIAGEGRILASKELRRETVPAIVVDADEGEIVGRFLAENMFRKKLPWQDKARLIKSEIGDERPSKALLKRLSDTYFVTPAHVAKLLRILQQAAPKTRETLDELTVGEAEELTSLPATGQEIVIETLKESDLDASQLPAVVRKAKELRRGSAGLSKTALKQSLKRVDEDLARLRASLKLKRLHFSLGPENLRMLLSDSTFMKALDRRQINYRKFEEAA